MPSSTHKKQFKEDIRENLATILSQNRLLTVDEAMKQVQATMLANNPFVPPTGNRCPVNDLPNEILGHIFYLGACDENGGEDVEDDDDDDDDALDITQGWDTASEATSEGVADSGDDEKTGGDVDMESSKSSGSSHSKCSTCHSRASDVPFQVVVSHVCSHWRAVALSTPSLWTTIDFDLDHRPFNRCRTWIERAKGLPLNINVDCTREVPEAFDDDGDDDDDVRAGFTVTLNNGGGTIVFNNTNNDIDVDIEPPGSEETTSDLYFTDEDINLILDIICPHSQRWQSLLVSVLVYKHMHMILSRLAVLPAAPLLEDLQLYHYAEEDLESDALFSPASLKYPFFIPFQGQTPRLKHLALWRVHLAWDETNVRPEDKLNAETSPAILFHSTNQITDLELAYHVSDVRPSFTTFSSILQQSSRLSKLSLCASGPAGSPKDWPSSKLSLPQLRELVLCYHEPEHAIGLVQILDVPSLRELTLDFDSADYSDFVKVLAGEAVGDRAVRSSSTGKKRSLLSGLEYLKISGLPCDKRSVELLLGELGNLRHIALNCASEEVKDIFTRLKTPINSSSNDSSHSSFLYCPSLQILATTDVSGEEMREMVDARIKAGVPLRKVLMGQEDDVDEKDANWLQNRLPEGLDFFEPSDSEEELDILDDDDDDDEDYF